MLLSLLANALKFTLAGVVTFSVEEREPGEESKDGMVSLLFEVSDTGIGVARDQLPKLFKLFGSLEEGSGRGGVGLGLTVSQKIVNKMGGRIEVKTARNVGSSFFFTIPLRDLESEVDHTFLPSFELHRVPEGQASLRRPLENASNSPIRDEEKANHTPVLQRRRIGGSECKVFVVDESPMSVQVMQLLLEKLDIRARITCYTDRDAFLQEALELLSSRRQEGVGA